MATLHRGDTFCQIDGLINLLNHRSSKFPPQGFSDQRKDSERQAQLGVAAWEDSQKHSFMPIKPSKTLENFDNPNSEHDYTIHIRFLSLPACAQKRGNLILPPCF
jgi:hypothetical protein